jgi:4-hydroxy-tetrahydrodipicolinate synthase
VDQAFQTLFQMTSIIDMIFEQGNPAGIKQVFQSLGIANNTVRLPLVKVDDSLANRIDQFVQKSNN